MDGDSDGDGIKVKINRKLVLLRDDEPNRRVARTLFVWGGPVSGTQGPESISHREHRSRHATQLQIPYLTSLRFIPRNVPAVLTLLFRTRSGRAKSVRERGNAARAFYRFCPKKEKREGERKKKRKTTESLERQ